MPNEYHLSGDCFVKNVGDDCAPTYKIPADRIGVEQSLLLAWRHFKIPTEVLHKELETTLCDLARGLKYTNEDTIFMSDKINPTENTPSINVKLRPDTPLTLALSIADATTLYSQLLKSRDGLRAALKTGDGQEAGFYFGWLDAGLTRLADACPEQIKPGANNMAIPRSGGGGKPK